MRLPTIPRASLIVSLYFLPVANGCPTKSSAAPDDGLSVPRLTRRADSLAQVVDSLERAVQLATSRPGVYILGLQAAAVDNTRVYRDTSALQRYSADALPELHRR